MLTSFSFEETKKLGITKEVVTHYVSKVSNLDHNEQSSILSEFLLGETEIVVELKN